MRTSRTYFDDAERENHTREWGLPAGQLTPYVRAMWDRATTPNGVLGSKLMWNNFDWLRSTLHPPAGTDAGLQFMRTTFPDAQFLWLRRADKMRQGSSWWRAAVTHQWALRPGQEADQPPPGVEQMVQLVRFAQRCEDGWRQWFASTGIQPCQSPLRRPRTGQARRRERSPGVSPPSATRRRRPSARSLPQAG
jgi:LPS sulfotransferase NodH